MNNNIKMICCTLTGLMVGGLTVVGANQAIQAIQNNQIKVSLNGIVQEFRDESTNEVQYPLTYNDRTYLPLRNVAQLSGLKVDYDYSSNTAILTKESDAKSFDSIFKNIIEYDKLTGNYISIDKYTLDGKVIFACCGGDKSNKLEIYDENGNHLHSGNGDFGESNILVDDNNNLYYFEYNTDGYENTKVRVDLSYKDGVFKAVRENKEGNKEKVETSKIDSNKKETREETIARFIRAYNDLNPDYMISEISYKYSNHILFSKDGIGVDVYYDDGKIKAVVTESTWVIDGVRKNMFKGNVTRYNDVIYYLALVGDKNISRKNIDEIYQDLEEGKYASALINNTIIFGDVAISYYNQKDYFSTTIELYFD